MSAQNPLLDKAVSLDGTADTIRDFYKDWAETYDHDLLQDIGYVGPAIAAAALAERVEQDATVLDAGCGTGLVGLELRKRHPGLVIDGIDLTPEMLEQSGKKHVYRSLMIADMSGPLAGFEPNTYDGVVCAGVFTNGHVGPDGIDELIRIAKPGAPVVLTVRDSAWEADGFDRKIATLDRDNEVRVVGLSEGPYHTKEGIRCQLVVLEAT